MSVNHRDGVAPAAPFGSLSVQATQSKEMTKKQDFTNESAVDFDRA